MLSSHGGTVLSGPVLMKSEVEGGEGKRGSSEDLELLCKDRDKL